MSRDTLIMIALSKDNRSYFSSDEEAERENVTNAGWQGFCQWGLFLL